MFPFKIFIYNEDWRGESSGQGDNRFLVPRSRAVSHMAGMSCVSTSDSGGTFLCAFPDSSKIPSGKGSWARGNGCDHPSHTDLE